MSDGIETRPREEIERAAAEMHKIAARGAIARGAVLGAWLALRWVLDQEAVTIEERLSSAGVLDV